MKKLIALTLALIMCLSLISCNDEENTSMSVESTPAQSESNTDTSQSESVSNQQTESQSTVESQSDSESESSAEDEDKTYLSVPRFKPSGYDRNHFVVKDSSFVITLELPREWTITKSTSDEYQITRGKIDVGRMTSKPLTDNAEWSVVTSREKQIGQMTATESVEKKGTESTPEFRYRWRYTYTENETPHELNLYVTCAEVPALISYNLLSQATIKPRKTDPNLGILPSSLDGKSMLILGNSFVGTSSIAEVLQDLFYQNGKTNSVSRMSIGMGSIAKYSIDEGILSTIRSGAYDVLFISGFYTQNDTYSLEIFKQACEQGGVTLIVLPAHNENQASAENSAAACDLPIINWKSELDELISSGVDKFDLCVNDSYYHSTPLAGYVGAHMIYRAIYGEAPENHGTYVSEYELSKLGDYAQTGSFYTASPDIINYLG